MARGAFVTGPVRGRQMLIIWDRWKVSAGCPVALLTSSLAQTWSSQLDSGWSHATHLFLVDMGNPSYWL